LNNVWFGIFRVWANVAKFDRVDSVGDEKRKTEVLGGRSLR